MASAIIHKTLIITWDILVAAIFAILEHLQLTPANRNSIIFTQENAFENVVCQNGGHLVQEG